MATKHFNLPADIVHKMIKVRRAIHSNPELSHHEHQTSLLIREELEAAGISEIEVAFNTGLVVIIKGCSENKTLALRADLDALPLDECTNLPFSSTNPGVMHACGHDSHAAILLGVALTLHRIRDELHGTIRCIFQPAEECEPLGAREIVKAGYLEGVDAIIGLHVDPELPVGSVAVVPGLQTASADQLTITIRGHASHGAEPHLGIDTVSIASTVIQELQKIPSRRIDPLVPSLITIGKVQGGTARNIIAEEIHLEGIIRALDESVRDEIGRIVRSVVNGVASIHGATAQVEIVRGEPVGSNDPCVTDLVQRASQEILNPDCVIKESKPSLGSEDFAFYLQKVPGVMFKLGTRNEMRGIVHPLHHPGFIIDEDALPIGAAIMLQAAKRFLETGEVSITAKDKS